MRILLVDDSDADRYLFRRTALQVNPDAVIVEVTSGAEAIAWIEANGAPDRVVLDVLLPDVDGHELAERIRAMVPATVPILLRSAAAGTPAAGGDDVLPKTDEATQVVVRESTGPTAEELVATALRMAAEHARQTTAEPVPAPAPAQGPEPLDPSFPIGPYTVKLSQMRGLAVSLGMGLALMIGGAMLGQLVLPRIGFSVETLEVRDLRLNEVRCQEKLSAAEERIARCDQRALTTSADLEAAKRAITDLARACGVGGPP